MRKKIHDVALLTSVRRELRQNQTPAEDLFWHAVKNRALGYKFRRQASIERFIVDFYCAEKRLIIEIDGKVHLEKLQKENDQVRDEFFRKLDYKVLRFTNEMVENTLKDVLHKLKTELEGKGNDTGSPSPDHGEGLG